MEYGAATRIPEVLRKFENEILADWIRQQLSAADSRRKLLKESELREESKDFLSAFRGAAQTGALEEISGPEWSAVRDQLTNLSRSRARTGLASSETATFVLSLKLPLFARLRQEYGSDAAGLGAEIWTVTALLDKLALFTTDVFLRSREETIARQQQEMLELSTPVVKLWEGILALPLIGTLDSARTQVVMESLLQQIVNTGAGIAIIDITGVPTVDTLVAQHLLKTVAAARLMGADCIISGIRPQIAQTIVHLGVALGDVITKATLADAIKVALERCGMSIVNKDVRA
jgi:rsbT co-antagonist protein RsbR